MAKYKATGGVNPSVNPNRAGEVITVAKEFDLAVAATALVADDIICFAKLPDNCAIVDCTVDVDSAIAGLAADIGVLNEAEDDTGAELFAAQPLATDSTVRVSKVGWTRTKTGDSEAWIAAKVTGGTAAVAGKITLHLSYRNTLQGV